MFEDDDADLAYYSKQRSGSMLRTSADGVNGSGNSSAGSGTVDGGSLKSLSDLRKSPVKTRRATVTKKSKVVGTPDYLSPEILLGTGHGMSYFLKKPLADRNLYTRKSWQRSCLENSI